MSFLLNAINIGLYSFADLLSSPTYMKKERIEDLAKYSQ